MSSHPSLVAPVSRHIGANDIERTAAFFQDVLGFEIRRKEDGMEAVRGPASSIHTGKNDYTTNDWTRPLPPGSAMLFFETDDVAAMRAAIEARGGNPGEMARINWVKMQVFTVRDPDGRAIWFGQSYDKPDEVRQPKMMLRALPCLPLSDVAAGVAYYVDVLGFHINYQQDDLGVMDRDVITLLLVARGEKYKGIGSAYFYVENADALYAELLAKDANLQGEPVSYPWGLRDFRVLDLEGNELTFGQTFE